MPAHTRLSTGLWISDGDRGARAAAVGSWSELPDFASVNFSEEGAVVLCRQLMSRGIAVEAGLATPADAELFVRAGVAPLRVLVEVDGDDRESLALAAAIEEIVAPAASRLLEHGYGRATWAVVRRAARLGHQIRVGLEDTLVLADGTVAADNAQLVRAAAKLLRETEAERRLQRSSA